VEGHKDECIVGYLQSIPTICFRGRFHFYEGHEMNTVVLPIRLMRAIGVKVSVPFYNFLGYTHLAFS
jgi:purine-nucleoside phosphorylase